MDLLTTRCAKRVSTETHRTNHSIILASPAALRAMDCRLTLQHSVFDASVYRYATKTQAKITFTAVTEMRVHEFEATHLATVDRGSTRIPCVRGSVHVTQQGRT